MGTTLQHGIFLPAEGERNCYAGLASNWTILDGVIGGYSSHAANLTIHVTAEDKEAWNGKADSSALTAHTGDTTIHVTAADKQTWNAVTGKANDADVVHKSGDETITGNKTFSSDITLQGTTTPVIKTISNIVQDSTGYNGSVSWVIRDKDNLNNILQSALYKYSAKSIDWQLKLTGIDNGVSNTKGIRFTLDPVNNVANFIPIVNNSTSLGNSSTKWKDVQTNLVNGLTPSNLGMPSDRSARVDISGYFTNTANGGINQYTAVANGFIYLKVSNVVTMHMMSLGANTLSNYADTKGRNSTGLLYGLFPVRKDDVFTCEWYTTTTVRVDGAFFIPCKGNI